MEGAAPLCRAGRGTPLRSTLQVSCTRALAAGRRAFFDKPSPLTKHRPPSIIIPRNLCPNARQTVATLGENGESMPRKASPLSAVSTQKLVAFLMFVAGTWLLDSLAVAAPQPPRCQALSDAGSPTRGLTNDARPPSVGSIDSTHMPLTIHYAAGVSLDYAHQILVAAEAAWQAEVNEMHFRPPLADGGLGGSDNLDIYIITTLAAGVGGYTGFSNFSDATMQTASAYIAVSDVLLPAYLRGAVAHEFFHTVQMAYRWWEEAPLLEGTATWVVNHVVPDEGYYWHYFPYMNWSPYRSLNYTSQSDAYQYGTALWFTFLDERFGAGDGAFIRRFWEILAGLAADTEPHYVLALTQLLGGREALRTAYVDFGIWRALLATRDDKHHFAHGAEWSKAVEPIYELSAEAGLATAAGEAGHALQPFGQALFSVAKRAGSSTRFTVTPNGNGDFNLAAVVRGATASTYVPSQTFRGGVPASMDVPAVAGQAEVIFVLSYFGDETDLDLELTPERSFNYQLEVP